MFNLTSSQSPIFLFRYCGHELTEAQYTDFTTRICRLCSPDEMYIQGAINPDTGLIEPAEDYESDAEIDSRGWRIVRGWDYYSNGLFWSAVKAFLWQTYQESLETVFLRMLESSIGKEMNLDDLLIALGVNIDETVYEALVERFDVLGLETFVLNEDICNVLAFSLTFA